MTEDPREDVGAGATAGPDAASGAETAASVETFAAETAAAEALAAGGAVDFRDRWLRAEADLQNFRRRAAREREETVRMCEDRLLLEMIDVLDDLERALAALGAPAVAETWAQGIMLTAQRLRDALARFGVSAMDVVGQPFRPESHEALLEIDPPDGIAPGCIASEIRRGYRRGDRALRAARVVVARMDG